MEKLIVRVGRNYYFLNQQDIDRIESDRNYIRIHCKGKAYVARRTLRSVEKRLDPDRFMRVNRSTIVNVGKIKELREEDNSTYRVILENEQSFSWGRRYRENLLRLLKI